MVRTMTTKGTEFEKAVLRGWQEWGVPKSMTGMYQATITHGYDDKGEPDLTTGIEEQCNVCAICLFLEDEPHNYGEIIIPTTYDGDCDECGRFTVDAIGDLSHSDMEGKE